VTSSRTVDAEERVKGLHDDPGLRLGLGQGLGFVAILLALIVLAPFVLFVGLGGALSLICSRRRRRGRIGDGGDSRSRAIALVRSRALPLIPLDRIEVRRSKALLLKSGHPPRIILPALDPQLHAQGCRAVRILPHMPENLVALRRSDLLPRVHRDRYVLRHPMILATRCGEVHEAPMRRPAETVASPLSAHTWVDEPILALALLDESVQAIDVPFLGSRVRQSQPDLQLIDLVIIRRVRTR